jgi:hypothetical protein
MPNPKPMSAERLGVIRALVYADAIVRDLNRLDAWLALRDLLSERDWLAALVKKIAPDYLYLDCAESRMKRVHCPCESCIEVQAALEKP